jgi:hypothetical protein
VGEENWDAVARSMPRRSVGQCRERLAHYLSPNVFDGQWSKAEDKLLEAKVRELGRKWKLFEPFFLGRTDVNIKNRCTAQARKLQRRPIDESQIGHETATTAFSAMGDSDDTFSQADWFGDFRTRESCVG